MSTAIEKTLRWIAILGVFTLPFIVFIVANGLFFPYITGKNFAFRLIVEIMAGAWLVLALVKSEYRPRKNWLLAAFAAFAVIVALADAFGANPFKSFWSNFERMDGWITLAHLLLYFAVASSVLNTEKLWRAFWLFTLGISSLVALHGILQALGIAATDQGFSSTTRVSATFGNPIYLAGYMLFHVFIAAILISRYGSERFGVVEKSFAWVFLGVFSLSLAIIAKSAGWEPYAALVLFGALVIWLLSKEQKYLLYLLLAVDALVLFLTGTRGAMLGLVGGALLALCLYALLAGSGRIRIAAAVSIVAVILAALGLYAGRDSAFVRSVPSLTRLATISLEDNTTKARFMNWGMAWQGVKERPILGWGQENYAIVFDKYYNPQMYAQEQWFDRVHDVVFDWLVAAGFLGLSGYLSIFAFALFYIWRPSALRGSTEANTSNVRRQGGTEALIKQGKAAPAPSFGLLEKSILTGLLAAYLFQNLFVFDNITSYVLFATVLAYIASRLPTGQAGATAGAASFILSARALPYRYLPLVAGIAVFVVWGAAWALNSKALAQGRNLIRAISQQEAGIEGNLKYFKEAAGVESIGTQEAVEQISQAAVLIAQNPDISNDVRQQFLQLAKDGLKKQSDLSPLDARFPLFLGVLLTAYGDLEGAGNAYSKALELSPAKQTILYEIGQNAILRGDAGIAEVSFRKALLLAPENDTARIYYAAFLIRASQDKLADEVLSPIIGKPASADSRIVGAYASRGRYDKIADVLKARIAAAPEDMQVRFTLAAALYADGKSQEAIAILEEAVRIDPNARAQVDSLIAEIKSGTATIGK